MVPYLPPEIMFNILLRVPARTVMICKCVCRSWLDLLVTPEFVKSHYSNSAPGLAIFEWKTDSKSYKIVQFVDEVDLNCHKSRWDVVFDFDLPFDEPLYASANGLIFHRSEKVPDIFISNPITREYIKLPSPPPPCWIESYGFGVSRMSGQYKVVVIFCDEPFRSYRFKCQVYTVGTGSWRRITFDDQLKVIIRRPGAFLNGNIHWLAGRGSSLQVLCLDLETESFSTFSPPPPPPPPPSDDLHSYRNLYVLGDCLSVCDNFDDGWPNCRMDIWLMKEYGKEKSWTKEFVTHKFCLCVNVSSLRPIKVFEDGDILIALVGYSNILLYFSRRTQTLRHVGLFGSESASSIHTISYTPSFLSLKTYVLENVASF